MTLNEEIDAIQSRLKTAHAQAEGTVDGLGKMIRSENDAQWEAIRAIAARVDALD
jgi:hypothetical protein